MIDALRHERPRLEFVADIAANHDGSLDRATRLIELAAEAGATAAKFQHFRAETIVSSRGFSELGGNASHQANWERGVVDTYRRYALPYEWTETLAARCRQVGIEFMSTPYDFESVDLLAPIVSRFKIGSGDISWQEFIGHVADQGKPVLLATGASTWSEVSDAVSIVEKASVPLTLMQCNTNYTAAETNRRFLNLRVLESYRSAFPWVTLGLSDHTKGSLAVSLSIALGATVFERHFTDDSSREGPDHTFSLTPTEWKSMVDRAHDVQECLGTGGKVVEPNEVEARVVQRRAIRFVRPLTRGQTLTRRDLAVLRPCRDGDVDASRLNDVLGRVLTDDVEADEVLKWELLR